MISKWFFSLVIMLASLYTIVYMVSLVEISSYVNSRPDMKSIKAHWKDRFLVAVDSNQKIIGTIAFAEKNDIHWKGVPIEGETVEINSVLGKFSIKNWNAGSKSIENFGSYKRVSSKGNCKKTDEVSFGKGTRCKYILRNLFCSVWCSQVLWIFWFYFQWNKKKLFRRMAGISKTASWLFIYSMLQTPLAFSRTHFPNKLFISQNGQPTVYLQNYCIYGLFTL